MVKDVILLVKNVILLMKKGHLSIDSRLEILFQHVDYSLLGILIS